MDKEKLLKREETDRNLRWDLTPIYKDDEEYSKAAEKLTADSLKFTEEYRGSLKDSKTILKAMEDYENIMILTDRLEHYVSLHLSEDRTNDAYLKNYMAFQNRMSGVRSNLSFFDNELMKAPASEIEECIKISDKYSYYIKDLMRYKDHMLSDETEKVLASLQESLDVPYNIYETAKLSDLSFPEFEVNGKRYPLSFVNFEGEYEYEMDTDIRREAFRVFSENLRKYMNTIGSTYAAQVRNEKIEADLRGYESVFDFLLMRQKVTREMYDRQLDVIMEKLAPHMRRYAELLKRVHGLDKMTYADLKLDLDPKAEPAVTVEESRKYVTEGLGILGEDYKEMLNKALDEGWIDFVQNIGKSTGAFCANPAGVHPYVLISWTYKMREAFVLAHELGHAGQSFLSGKNVNYLNDNLSMYAVEAPSTTNELILAKYLTETMTDLRMKRWVIASIISRTYFHNFVTHFLEGYYQREVYKLVDAGQPVGADDFCRIFNETLKKFWGDDIELTEGSELTWMRQPHYYIGLYPYTYSAGLTIGTGVVERIRKEGQKAVDDWRKVLSMGGTLTPMEFAEEAGIDISTDAALKNTIEYIGSLIDQLYELTDEIEKAE